MTQTLPAAVLWDMDGTLVDTEPYWMQAQDELVAAWGGEWTHEDALTLVGSGLWHAARVFQSRGVHLTEDEIVEHLTDRVLELIDANGLPWRPGARELLSELREAGVKTALVTMSVRRMAEHVAAQLGFDGFDTVVSGDDVTHAKPHPEPYLTAVERLGVDAAACVAIEDSAPGIGLGRRGRRRRDRRAVRAAAARERRLHPLGESRRPHARAPECAARAGGDMTGRSAARPSGPFRYGDRVQLTGPKNRLNTISLVEGGEFHSHHGVIKHVDLVGLPDASVLESSNGFEYLAMRPLLTDFVMSMPRGAAIIYPKDAAQIIGQADIFPGAVVVEAGVGSGALSLWLLRAIGPEGRLVSFERRAEFADIARGNVAAFLGEVPQNWSVEVGDLQEALPTVMPEGSVDRIVLDMLAPWECLDECATALTPGGVLICYIATVTQLSRVAEAIRATGQFTDPEPTETLVRGWHVEGLAVRPDHRMIGHTGFLMTARRLAPGTVLPAVKRRASKSEFTDEDVELWTPGAVGERTTSDKRLRKAAREARAIAGDALGESAES